MATTKGKRVPPSRARYEATHKTVSARLDAEVRRQLDLLKFESGMSTADVIRIALDKAKPDLKAAYERGVEDGYGSARALYEVAYRCAECGERHLSITSEEEAKAAADFMHQQGWHDPSCR